MMDDDIRSYVTKIAIGLAITLSITIGILIASPLGDLWTPIAVGLSLPVIGLAVAIKEGW